MKVLILIIACFASRSHAECSSGETTPWQECSSHYVVCIDETLISGQCNGSDVFDLATLSCTSADNCPTQLMTTATSGTSPCPENGTYAIPGQVCGPHYEICVDGNVTQGKCLDDTVFDPTLLACTSADSCHVTQCPPNGIVLIPGEECTPNYTICMNGFTTFGLCSNGTVFDSNVLACTSLEICQSFHCPADLGVFPVPGQECTQQFEVCVNGIATIESCNGTEVFDPTFLACTSPENCHSLQCPADNGLFPIPGQECAPNFEVCVNGTVSMGRCNGTDVFDSSLLACTSPEACNMDKTTTTTSTKPSTGVTSSTTSSTSSSSSSSNSSSTSSSTSATTSSTASVHLLLLACASLAFV